MNGTEHIAVEDLALFALLLLSEEDAAPIRAHLAACGECSGELKQVREDLATYALAVEPLEIPQGARDRFMTKLDAEPHAARTSVGPDEASGSRAVAASSGIGLVDRKPSSRPATAKVLPWVSWIGWAAAAAAVVAAVNLKQDRDGLRAALQSEHEQTARLQANEAQARHILGTLTDPSAVRVNLTIPKAPSTPAARATYEPKSGTLLLLASNLQPLAQQKVYELWLIPADGSKPVAAGTFSPDAHGNASLLVPTLHGAVAAKAFGITVEPAGGSVTPTMPIVLAGAPA